MKNSQTKLILTRDILLLNIQVFSLLSLSCFFCGLGNLKFFFYYISWENLDSLGVVYGFNVSIYLLLCTAQWGIEPTLDLELPKIHEIGSKWSLHVYIAHWLCQVLFRSLVLYRLYCEKLKLKV